MHSSRVFSFMWLVSGLWIGNGTAQSVQSCETIVQTYVTAGTVAYLSADVPANQGTRDKGAVSGVKGPREGDAWVTCTTLGKCSGANIPDLSHPGADPQDASPRYAGFFSATTAASGGFVFASPRWIRLVTNYTMTTPNCLSQATFEVNANADYPLLMFIPPGRSIKRITTFVRELVSGQAGQWLQCDDVTNPPRLGWIGPVCDGKLLNFGYKALPPDASDGATGIYVGCVNKIVGDISIASTNRRGCRVQLQY
jgi:hypothetical protein